MMSFSTFYPNRPQVDYGWKRMMVETFGDSEMLISPKVVMSVKRRNR